MPLPFSLYTAMAVANHKMFSIFLLLYMNRLTSIISPFTT